MLVLSPVTCTVLRAADRYFRIASFKFVSAQITDSVDVRITAFRSQVFRSLVLTLSKMARKMPDSVLHSNLINTIISTSKMTYVSLSRMKTDLDFDYYIN